MTAISDGAVRKLKLEVKILRKLRKRLVKERDDQQIMHDKGSMTSGNNVANINHRLRINQQRINEVEEKMKGSWI